MRALNHLVVLLTLIGVFSGCSSGSSEGSDPERLASESLSGSRVRLRKVPQPADALTVFETLQVRPLAYSADDRVLYALNTPDNRLEIFRVRGQQLDHLSSVEVGLEPVSVALRSEEEVWVVNHLSDSVSVIDVTDVEHPSVSRTLLVGDEPRDIVFAGKRHDRAFITTAHRGQDSPDDPDLFTPGIGRADVWVFDANNLGSAPGGTRLTKLTFFADSPRALAASADGKTVYVAAFLSGNQTSTASADVVSAVYPNGLPGPTVVTSGGTTRQQPPIGFVIKWKQGGPDGGFHWLDAYGGVFDPFIRVRLPDQDVFAIDAMKSPPAPAAMAPFAHVGTTLFNMAVNPKNGKVYVSNTDAHNDVRFEGHTPDFTSVVGNAVDSRISVLDPRNGLIVADNLNPHIDHQQGTGDASLSRAFPQDLAVSANGEHLYVVAQGSSKLALYDTAELEAGSAVPTRHNQIDLSGGGPSGVVVDDDRGIALVLTRFDNSVSVVDLKRKREVAHVAMYNPEPVSVTRGRRFLYDARHTSALGDQACSSCHIGGDVDALAWDLGNPSGIPLPISDKGPTDSSIFATSFDVVSGIFGPGVSSVFGEYPAVKGIMVTQSLRGLDNTGPMHWRGDRNGAIQQNGLPFLDSAGQPVSSVQPNSGIFDEFRAFTSFNVAFPGLVGNAQQLPAEDMDDFARFTLQITYPPNPIRNLDNSLTTEQELGRKFFFNNANGVELPSDRLHSCNGCHVLDREANLGSSAHPGFFGTDGRLAFDLLPQAFKVPHLRNAYQKIGMYGSVVDQLAALASVVPQLNPPVDAVRGFGYSNDGIVGTIEHFHSSFVFVQSTVPLNVGGGQLPPNPDGIPFFADPANPLDPSSGLSQEGLDLRREVASYVLAFDSNLYPIVGKQVTFRGRNQSASANRTALLISEANAKHCDLIARTTVLGREAGFTYADGAFVADSSLVPPLPLSALLALAGNAGSALTFTAVPPGSGWRMGVDRDSDGYLDGDERALGSDPADASSKPARH